MHLPLEQVAIESTLDTVHEITAVVPILLRLLVLTLELLAPGTLKQLEHGLEKSRLMFAWLLAIVLLLKSLAVYKHGPPRRQDLSKV